MTRSVLIGKGRRVTLEELQSVALYDGVLELQTSDGTDTSTSEASLDGVTVALAGLAIEASTNDDNDDDNQLLSTSATIAALTILALNLSQGRILKSECDSHAVVMTIVNLVNVSKRQLSNNNNNNSNNNSLRLSSDPSKFLPSLCTTFLSGSPLESMSKDMHSTTSVLVTRLLDLAVGGLATIRTVALASAATQVAALSAERTKANLHAFSETKYDVHRPHRGLVTTAAALRAILQGSKYVTNSKGGPVVELSPTASSIEAIPQQHGPAQEAAKAARKTLELDLNCFESSVTDHLDVTVATLALKQVHEAVLTLVNASLTRIGGNSTITSTSNDSVGLALEVAVAQLETALKEEAKMGCEFLKTETESAAEEARQREAVKTARAAAAAPRDATSGGDEFAGTTETQKAKILKKRAEKEAKAAKKAAAKQSKGVSLFGAGTQSICDLVVSANFEFAQSTIDEMDDVVNKLLSGGMQRKPKIAKGTRDYLPEQMMIRQQAFDVIRRVFQSHGAVEIDTPVFELKETLTGKYGEDSKLIYDLADQGGEMLALRYDLTVPFARFLALNPVGNIKRFHIGKVYRRDQPALSRGRYREFYQCDFDIAGDYATMVPDSECLTVACEILDALPIGDFGIKVNHRCLLDAILDICGVPADKFRTICSAVDKLDKEEWLDVKREMVEDKGLDSSVADKIGEFVVKQSGEPWTLYYALMDQKKFGKHPGALKAMEELKIMFEYLEAMDKLKFISFDLSLARGLDYYTGVIYEAVCMSGNTQVGSIGGGGRYDNLVSMFQEAGKQTPCVGVSVGIERVFTLMEARLREEQGGSIKQPNVDVLVASVGVGMMVERMKLTKLLWDSKISAEFSQQENPKLKYEIADALERGIPFMVIIGEDEVKEGKCKVKDLKARTEEPVSMSELVSVLRTKGAIPVGCEFAVEMLSS